MIGPTSRVYFSQRLRLHYVDWGNPEAPPLLFVHGGRDPRTEPGELDALRATLARAPANRAPATEEARFAILPEGGHSPHSERATADEVTRIAAAFLREERA